MDNRVTKKRISIHLEYDWLKYLLILVASIVLWYFVFYQINLTRDFEKVDVFFTCYGNSTPSIEKEFLDVLVSENDDYIREVNINFQSPDNEYYSQLYTSHGYVADVLIIPKYYMDNNGFFFKEWTDEFIEDLFTPAEGEEFTVDISDLDFYRYTTEGKDPNNAYAEAEGKCYGIRVDNLAKIAVDYPPFWFDPQKMYPDSEINETWTSEDYTQYYLVISPNSIKIGNHGRDEAYRHLTQTFRFVRWFVQKYA